VSVPAPESVAKLTQFSSGVKAVLVLNVAPRIRRGRPIQRAEPYGFPIEYRAIMLELRVEGGSAVHERWASGWSRPMISVWRHFFCSAYCRIGGRC
jgi:hypothetical protein